MSPMYAACTSEIVPSSDLVFVEFVQNDGFRTGGVQHHNLSQMAINQSWHPCTLLLSP